MLFLDLGLTITGNYIERVQKQENKNESVKRCRDGMPKSMQTSCVKRCRDRAFVYFLFSFPTEYQGEIGTP